MFNNILLGVIGLLMTTITGVGVVSATTHPEKVAEVGAEVVQTAERVIVQVQGGAQKLGLRAQNTQEQESNATQGVSASTHKSDDEKGQENEDENDDRSLSAASNTTTSTSVSTPTPATNTAESASSSVKTFTMVQVASHNSAASCYSAISGSVYDLTPFINQHPGGSAAIKSLCGVDGTTAFNAQHGGASRPASELASLKIGVLAQ